MTRNYTYISECFITTITMNTLTKTDERFVCHMVDNIIADIKMRDCEDDILKIHALINTNTSSTIKILRNIDVLKWIFGNLTFLNIPVNMNRNKGSLCRSIEYDWGCSIVRSIRPEFESKQWTTIFGETVAKELYELMGHSVMTDVPVMNHLHPDVLTTTHVVEAKTQTYHTTGTAGEKILGTPFKYAEVPDLYGKPLHILCIGAAEKKCREDYGNLGETTGRKKSFIDFYKSMNIYYVAATDALLSLISTCKV
ncbi:hypothetical protein PBCVCVB1_770L [Paramecium bursaria Chlorella virus CVB-1]|nr:hypothetical protein PBCVCVB1_770L [Paramecium bursaria Chlorella virus CVB-1]